MKTGLLAPVGRAAPNYLPPLRCHPEQREGYVQFLTTIPSLNVDESKSLGSDARGNPTSRNEPKDGVPGRHSRGGAGPSGPRLSSAMSPGL